MGDSIEELERFFADLTSRSEAISFRGVRLDAFYVGWGHGLTGLLSVLAGLVERLGGQRRGIYVRAWLPVAVGADLLLESRMAQVESGDPLDAHFVWSATSELKIRRYLEGPLLEALILLRDRHTLKMTDQVVELGPFSGAPTDSARAVALLVDALPRAPKVDEVSDTGPLEMDADVEPVTIRTTTSRMQADLWRSLLEASQIPCLCHGYEQSAPWGAATPMVPIHIMVPERQADRAREILDQAGQGTDADAFCHSCGAQLPEGAEWCPECRVKFGEDKDGDEPPEKL
jgi:hypothetical protein